MKKTLLIYDISNFPLSAVQKRQRTGIFFVALNVLKSLLTKNSFEIQLYCYPEYLEKLKAALEREAPESADLKIFNQSQSNFFTKYKKKAYLKKELCRTDKKIIRKVFWLAVSNIAGFVGKIPFAAKKLFLKTGIIRIDAFLSPHRAPPAFINKQKNIKKFVILHDAIPLLFQERALWKDELMKVVNAECFYFANSKNTKNDFVNKASIDPDKITIIPLSSNVKYGGSLRTESVNLKREKNNIPPNSKYILSLCTLEPKKNIPFAIKNYTSFIKKHDIKNLLFVLAGASWPNFAETLSLNLISAENRDKFIFTGYVADEDVEALYKGAEFFIHPSLYEGFGMPILEAMKCGCPVICSNTSSMPEVIGDAGITIDPVSDEQMINAFEKMYFDAEFRNECAKKGLERSKLFSWEKAADIIENTISRNLSS